MSNSHTVVTYTSWGERMQSACCGVCLGILLFFGSFPLLVWNEGRCIARYQALKEGRKAVVVIADPTAHVDSSREGALVYMSGKAEVAADGATASDPTFGVVPSNALKLTRVAEMFQWEEEKSTHTTKTEGGGTRIETTYSYHQTWSEGLINSGSFDDSSSYQNPSSMPYSSQEFAANPIALGSYTLSNDLVNKINWYSDLNNDGSLISVDNISDEYARQNMVIYGNGFYMGDNPGYPDIGDMKIKFQYVPEGTVSLIAAQTGSTFSSYATKRGGSLLLLRSGYHSADNLFTLAERDNAVVTWLVRLVGFIMMYIGLNMVSQPLEVVLDRIPFVGRFVGDLMGGATTIVNCIVAAALSISTIALAWFVYRPLLTFSLLGIVGGLVYLMKRKVESKRYGEADHEVPLVDTTPIYKDGHSGVDFV
mmetsp:Transcript_3002/g.5504  ORF Transcript_3002/g.5504 Transcript_3002/m.5504 type:complete len:423 (+) Transcript_3002:202-1470(+)